MPAHSTVTQGRPGWCKLSAALAALPSLSLQQLPREQLSRDAAPARAPPPPPPPPPSY